jgi:iron-sulfur cluster assembly accessory protein
MISLTDKAVEKLKAYAEEGGCPLIIRVSLKSGGCSGFRPDLCFEEVVSDLDEVFEIDGVKVIIDPISLSYLEGCKIDYQDDLFASGFKFLEMKTTGSCGCGKSVAF